MAASTILNLWIYIWFQVFCLRHLLLHLCAKFGWNRTINNEVADYYVKFKMAAVAILDFGCNFRFWNFSVHIYVTSMCFKFHQNRLIFARVIAFFQNPRWRLPPSWIQVFTSGFRFFVCDTFSCTTVQNLVEIGQLATKWQHIMWNSRWRPRPSWILVITSGFDIFRLEMMLWVCVSNFIKIRQYLPVL